MKLNPPSILQLFALLLGLWCAFPAAAQELTELDDSCEDVLVLEDCSTAEKCCAQAAPIRAILLSIARCSADPEPLEDFCEMLPHAPLPRSVLTYILRFEAAKNLHHDQNFLQAAHNDHQPIPPAPLSIQTNDQAPSEHAPTLSPPSFTEITLPRFIFEARLLVGVYQIPETPG